MNCRMNELGIGIWFWDQFSFHQAEMETMSAHVWFGPVTGTESRVWLIEIRNREDRRNAIDREVAKELVKAFEAFEKDELSRVAVLSSTGPTFCAGADLKAVRFFSLSSFPLSLGSVLILCSLRRSSRRMAAIQTISLWMETPLLVPLACSFRNP